MKGVHAALWTETLKFRRAKVPLFTAFGFSIIPPLGGLFMIILRDPEAARSMGLISTKARLLGGTADWLTFFSLLSQALAVGGAIVMAILTAWMFRCEFRDRTAKELLALPTSRDSIVAAKFIVMAVWALMLTAWIFVFGILAGGWVGLPGWSPELLDRAYVDVFGSAVLTILLLPCVAFLPVSGMESSPPSVGLS